MAKVAFVGLGVMGYPMAGHLKAKGGHDVTVYNRTGAKAEKWVAQHGGKSAPTPKQAESYPRLAVDNPADCARNSCGRDVDVNGVTSSHSKNTKSYPPQPAAAAHSVQPVVRSVRH